MSEMTIGKRFVISSASSGFLILGLSVVTLFASRSFDKALTSLSDDAIPSETSAQTLQVDTYRLRGDYLKHIALDKPADLDKTETEIATDLATFNESVARYKKTLDDTDEDRANLAAIISGMKAFDEAWKEVLPISRAGKSEDAVVLFNAKALPKFNALTAIVDRTMSYNQRMTDATTVHARDEAATSLKVSLGLGLLAVVLSGIISWFMVTSTNKILRQSTLELSDGADQVSSAAGQVSTSAQSLAQESTQQAATIEETSAASMEINSMAQRNTENAKATAAIMARTAESFRETNRLLDDLLTAMSGIDDSSQQISKIIKVIDEIAFQTNILALNAAVEAARAGEAGMGFAVVADEVRSLAQRSAQAAKDTAVLIEDSIHRSSNGKHKVDQVAAAIRAITAESGTMKTLVDEIHLGSTEQAHGIDKISSSIGRMEEVTQGTAANSEETAAASEQLSAQAVALQEIAARLTALVEGASARTERQAPSSSRLNSRRMAHHPA